MKSIIGVISGFIISAIIIVTGIFGTGFLDTVENKILDFRFLTRGTLPPGDEIIIIAIDEKTLDKLGRWPFPRRYFVDVVEQLIDAGVKVVGFDMIFCEEDVYSGISTVDYIRSEMEKRGVEEPDVTSVLLTAREKLDNDYHLSNALYKVPHAILGYYFIMKKEAESDLSEDEVNEKLESVGWSRFKIVKYESDTARDTTIRKSYSLETNIPLLSKSASSFGYFNVFPDSDGTIRWAPLTIIFQDAFYPSLALEMARAYLDAPSPQIQLFDDGTISITLDDINIPVNSKGELLINYRGRVKTFPYYSFVDVVNGDVPEEKIRDKIAIIGTTAVGTYDLRVTPLGSAFPGMEVNATIIDNILHQDFLAMPGWVPYLNLGVVLFLGLLFGLIIPRVRGWIGALFAISLTILWLGLAEYFFIEEGIWIMVIPPLLTIAIAYTILTLIRYITVEQAGRRIKDAFQFYVAETVVDEILKDPSMLTLGGEKKDISVLFSDIKGFTSISEELSPEELVNLLNDYLTVMTDLVFYHRGLLDKYIGDAIMAVYGAPLAQEDHPLRVCLTALDMIAELEKLKKQWKAQKKPQLDIRIGINSGYAVVGNMGSKKRFDYTVMGDNVNLASRLEGINKIYDTSIIISEYTFERVKGEMACRELDQVRVKGKTIPVKIYELIGLKGKDQEREEMALEFEMGLNTIREMNWGKALTIFKNIKGRCPDDLPTDIYIGRVMEALVSPPPADWDGVFEVTNK